MNSLLFENLQLMHESKFNRKIMKESVNTKYAGVNTYNGVAATQFNNDSSPIIFWAGSEGKSDKEIQEAKF